MKNLFTWIIFLLLTGAVVTCTPDVDFNEPQKPVATIEGFYKDTVTYRRYPFNIIDSVITKEVIKIDDSTYYMCAAICNGSNTLSGNCIFFTIHPDNTISPFVQRCLGLPIYSQSMPLPSYYVPSSGYIYIKFLVEQNSTEWIERLKKI